MPSLRKRSARLAQRPPRDDVFIVPSFHVSGSGTVRDIGAHLRFSPRTGHIRLGDERMMLLHQRSLAVLRRELVESLGLAAARDLLTRVGYASGAADAELARKVRSSPPGDVHAAGPQLHALEGMVSVEAREVAIDVPAGRYRVDAIWHESLEVDAHVGVFGVGADPVCWIAVGYASGYASTFMGRPILYREIDCRGTGASQCRVLGRPVDEGPDDNDDFRFLQPVAFVNREVPRRRRWPAAGAVRDDAAMPEMVGASAGFQAACQHLEKVARTNATVLFLGETGVGKELFAQTLHRVSRRARGPFVSVNCAAIPEALVESELFGVERGAFTGATQSRPGRFERADGGTLFLDEIGCLAFEVQAKLLRALQSREIERIGDHRARKIDVRIVAATNAVLEDAVEAGTFRADLYYRLNVFPISIPPLRQRRDDIPLLVDHMLVRFARLHEKSVTGFTQRAIYALLDYDYPGNIRELENMIERAVILASDGGTIDVAQLFESGRRPRPGLALDVGGGLEKPSVVAEHVISDPGEVSRLAEEALDQNLCADEFLECLIRRAVDRTDGNLASAARVLGLTRAQVAYRLRKKYTGRPHGADR